MRLTPRLVPPFGMLICNVCNQLPARHVARSAYYPPSRPCSTRPPLEPTPVSCALAMCRSRGLLSGCVSCGFAHRSGGTRGIDRVSAGKDGCVFYRSAPRCAEPHICFRKRCKAAKNATGNAAESAERAQSGVKAPLNRHRTHLTPRPTHPGTDRSRPPCAIQAPRR